MKRLSTYLRRSFLSPRRHTARPRLEQLESRLVPAVNLLNNFDGLVSGAPPDTCGAAGPNTYIETVNSSVAIYNKFTNASIASDTLTDFLWTVGGITPADGNAQLSDATICYDEPIGRFVVGDLDVDRSGPSGAAQAPSQFDFAVSTTSNPTALNTANWNFYAFSTTEGSGASSLWSDYPGNLGYNSDALVVTFNMYDDNNNFQHVQVNAFPQSSLAAASDVTDTYFDPTGFSWRPVTMHDSAAGGPMWFVTEHFVNGSPDNKSIDLERVDNILTAPSVHTFNISVNSYNSINNPLNPDGTTIRHRRRQRCCLRLQHAKRTSHRQSRRFRQCRRRRWKHDRHQWPGKCLRGRLDRLDTGRQQ
jgi:hypothetical protein